ncbi:hypothetical protein QL285_094687 [Trifolium repens]|nr:hypothetical protein QL285_094687 [Trifolium repens]
MASSCMLPCVNIFIHFTGYVQTTDGGGAAATVAVSDGGAGRKLARFAAVVVRRCWKRFDSFLFFFLLCYFFLPFLFLVFDEMSLSYVED